jgi:ribosomal protein S18 acetylase RimI-like enzyme
MIRAVAPADMPTLMGLAEGTGVFSARDLQALREVLDDYHAANEAAGHRAICLERAGELLGFAYYAPAAMTDRTWYLWWIAVGKERQAQGVGGDLLRHVEADIQARRGRQLLIETSSLPRYELTRRFYLKHGYERHATLADYYADGDDLAIFRKRW